MARKLVAEPLTLFGELSGELCVAKSCARDELGNMQEARLPQGLPASPDGAIGGFGRAILNPAECEAVPAIGPLVRISKAPDGRDESKASLVMAGKSVAVRA